ncbi:hypothetical protein AAC387_Pa06g1475 [Persea americana]
MSKCRAFSSPDLLPFADIAEDSALEGVTTNVKLLLKLIQEHNDGINKGGDERKPQRIAGMISILNDVKSKIEKVQVPIQKPKRETELRRCNSDLKRNQLPREKKPQESTQEENERLRRELFTSTAAKRNVERMFSSLGKEKEIMGAELARRVQELSGMEEHLNDVKVQNEMLLAKLHGCGAEDMKEKRAGGRENLANAALQERNKALSEQLLKSLDGYRALKRKLKDAQEENAAMKMKMAQVAEEVKVGLNRIHDMRQRLGGRSDMPMDIEEELAGVDAMFRCFESKLMVNGPKRGECVKPVGDVSAEKSPVLV